MSRRRRTPGGAALASALLLLFPACTPAPPAPPAPPPEEPVQEPVPEAVPAEPFDTAPYVVMISFDGMRHDFPGRVPTPSFDRLAADGVRADGLIPSYPSKTFPNHYTLVTGMYPANHGIVDNVFYDPAFDAVYALGSPSVTVGRWYGGEPIWATAERQGVTAASFFWVGSEAPVNGVRPTYWKPYDHDFPDAARVDTVLAWLELPPAERPRMITLYFDAVDSEAHASGVSDPAVDSTVVAMDRLLGRLLDGLEAIPHGDRVNVVVVSDHGMADVPLSNTIRLEDLVDLRDVRVIGNTTQAFLYFDGDEARLMSVYEALQERLEHATAYLKEELPAEWHYSDSRRVGDIVVSADTGWVVLTGDRSWRGVGMHGWDPGWPAMHGVFLAGGPDVRDAGRIPAFENIHVYPFVAALLDLEPRRGIDGRASVLAPYLATPVPAR